MRCVLDQLPGAQYFIPKNCLRYLGITPVLATGTGHKEPSQVPAFNDFAMLHDPIQAGC